MPPKKAKGNAKGGKGKDGGDGKPVMTAKMKKKEKKLAKKYGSLKYEDAAGKETYLMSMRRDELELAAEKLREEVTLSRSERIRYQLERDFLKDVVKAYTRKYKCLMVEQEAKVAQNNRLAQDINDAKIIKSIAGKHFRYEVQMMSAQMDVRDELRRKMLKEMLDKTWQFVSMEIDEENDKLQKNSEEYRKKISDLTLKLQDLEAHQADHEKQLEIYTRNLGEQMKNSMELFKIQRRIEQQVTEERWGEYIWALTTNFESDFDEMKQHYDEVTKYNLNMIFNLQDALNKSLNHIAQLEHEIHYLQTGISDSTEILPTLQHDHRRAKVEYMHMVRTKIALETSARELAKYKYLTTVTRKDYRYLVRHLNVLNEERALYRENSEDIINGVSTAYMNRYKQNEDDTLTTLEIAGRDNEKKRIMQFFPDEDAFKQTIRPFTALMDKKDAQLEKQNLKLTRIEKQYRDLRLSLEDRLKHVGLAHKHETVTPEQGTVLVHSHLLNRAPANLVAGRFYGANKPVEKEETYPCCGQEDARDELNLCLTESLRGFLAWRSHGGKMPQHPNQEDTMGPQPHYNTTATGFTDDTTDEVDNLEVHRSKSTHNAHHFYLQVPTDGVEE